MKRLIVKNPQSWEIFDGRCPNEQLQANIVMALSYLQKHFFGYVVDNGLIGIDSLFCVPISKQTALDLLLYFLGYMGKSRIGNGDAPAKAVNHQNLLFVELVITLSRMLLVRSNDHRGAGYADYYGHGRNIWLRWPKGKPVRVQDGGSNHSAPPKSKLGQHRRALGQ